MSPLMLSIYPRLAIQTHSYALQTFYGRVNRYLHSLIPFTGTHLDSFSPSLLLPSYDTVYDFMNEIPRHVLIFFRVHDLLLHFVLLTSKGGSYSVKKQ